MSSTKFYLSRDSIDRLGIPVGEVLMLLSVYFNDPINVTMIRNLKAKGLLDFSTLDSNGDTQFICLTQEGINTIETVFLNSELGNEETDRTERLAKDLQELFPKGKKPGTNYYFRGNLKDITLKLKKFFKLYGNKYTDEQILNAARAYVESFNGNYEYMRLLGYFIWKSQLRTSEDGQGYREEVSDLATYIENAGQENELSNDWVTTLK